MIGKWEKVIVIVTMSLISSAAVAHQDMVIEVGRDGTLSLPSQFQPATLQLERSDSRYIDGATLRLRDRVIEFPPCIASLFQLPTRTKMSLDASWYHKSSTLPPYLAIDLPYLHSKSAPMQGWSLLINLETAEILELRWKWITDDGYGQRSVDMDISAICSPEEVEQLRPRKIGKERTSEP